MNPEPFALNIQRLNSSDSMSRRFEHSSFVEGNAFYVSGGNDEDNTQMSGLWKYDLDTKIWTFTPDNIGQHAQKSLKERR